MNDKQSNKSKGLDLKGIKCTQRLDLPTGETGKKKHIEEEYGGCPKKWYFCVVLIKNGGRRPQLLVKKNYHFDVAPYLCQRINQNAEWTDVQTEIVT